MRFFIVDDDRAVRSILRQIIEDEDLGEAGVKRRTAVNWRDTFYA